MGTKLHAGMVVAQRYRLDAPLGEGGFGEVWRATQLNVSRPVAIKFLKPFAADESAFRRFDREARALARLQHPNCVTLLDFGHGDAGSFLVTEFLDGEQLDHWAEGNHDIATVLGVAQQILAALAHAHEQRIVHRDLKPANIIVARTPEGAPIVKVLDFGIASVVGAKRGDITKTGEVFGTPGYMSPEQLLGDAHVGPTADLYAFGVVLYQMIERRKLFTAGSGIEVAMRHLTHDPPPLTRDVPDGLQAVISRLLAKQPGERPASAEETARALARIGVTDMPVRPGVVPSYSHGPAQTPPTRPVGAGNEMSLPAQLAQRTPAPTQQPQPSAGKNTPLIALAVLLVTAVIALVVYIRNETSGGPEQAAQQTATSRAASSLVRESSITVEPIVREPEPNTAEKVPEPSERSLRSAGCGHPIDGRGLQRVSVMTSVIEEGSAIVYVPDSYDDARPHRMLVALHDTTQTPQELIDELGLDELADRDQIVIVLPEAATPFFPWKDPASWAQVEREIEVARRVLCVDPERVLLFGYGSGGHAAQKLACMLPAVDALVISTYRMLAGEPPCDHPTTPHLWLAPMQDGRDPADGGEGCIGGATVVSVDDHEAHYRQMYACGEAERTDFAHRRSRCTTWDCGAAFVSCRIDGGRPLPGTRFRINSCEGTAADFPYRTKIWDFLFAEHSKVE